MGGAVRRRAAPAFWPHAHVSSLAASELMEPSCSIVASDTDLRDGDRSRPPGISQSEMRELVELFFRRDRLSGMESHERKPRRLETQEERIARLNDEARKALDRALAEQDALDAMVRKSIATHGA